MLCMLCVVCGVWCAVCGVRCVVWVWVSVWGVVAIVGVMFAAVVVVVCSFCCCWWW